MKDIVYKILWSTMEDFVGSWEIIWELNSLLCDNDPKKNEEIASNILKYFLEQNLVTFYLNKWGSDELEQLQYNEAVNMLEKGYWIAPAINELCIKIGSTERGEKFYNDELVGDIM